MLFTHCAKGLPHLFLGETDVFIEAYHLLAQSEVGHRPILQDHASVQIEGPFSDGRPLPATPARTMCTNRSCLSTRVRTGCSWSSIRCRVSSSSICSRRATSALCVSYVLASSLHPGSCAWWSWRDTWADPSDRGAVRRLSPNRWISGRERSARLSIRSVPLH